MKQLRKYQLFATGPGGRLSNQISKYLEWKPDVWVVEVKAKSIKQAYWVTANAVVAERGKAGIVSVDRSSGPGGYFPWPDTLWPKHWGTKK